MYNHWEELMLYSSFQASLDLLSCFHSVASFVLDVGTMDRRNLPKSIKDPSNTKTTLIVPPICMPLIATITSHSRTELLNDRS